MDPYAAHAVKCRNVARAIARLKSAGEPVALRKPFSNLFRDRGPWSRRKLDARAFQSVLRIDPERCLADVEGMIPYDAFVRQTLVHGLLPAVVPELKSITVGGAVSGIGIESSSFRYGLVHETVEEMEILLGDGRIVVCSSRDNSDLFFGFPNSYGTLGYALRLEVRLIPAQPYVHLRHLRFRHPDAFFEFLAGQCSEGVADYLEGVVFGPTEMYVTQAVFRHRAPATSNYTWLDIYYQSIRRKHEDWLTASDYLWRWDTDWFWCSRRLHAQNRWVRLLATKWLLNSRTWQRVMRWSNRLMPEREGAESVIQDVQIPVGRAAEFLEFLLKEIGITPVWICPFRTGDSAAAYRLFAFAPRSLHINFGFWDSVVSDQAPDYFNRKIESKLLELGGKKALYSSVHFDADTFRDLYGGPEYETLKAKYDPEGVLGDLYGKCRGRERRGAPPPAGREGKYATSRYRS